jgi:hypothetical protein
MTPVKPDAEVAKPNRRFNKVPESLAKTKLSQLSEAAMLRFSKSFNFKSEEKQIGQSPYREATSMLNPSSADTGLFPSKSVIDVYPSARQRKGAIRLSSEVKKPSEFYFKSPSSRKFSPRFAKDDAPKTVFIDLSGAKQPPKHMFKIQDSQQETTPQW